MFIDNVVLYEEVYSSNICHVNTIILTQLLHSLKTKKRSDKQFNKS